MGLNHLPTIVDTLLAHGRPADTPVAVVQDGTTKEQRVVRGTLDEIADIVETHHIRPPAVVVIGEVVDALAG
jgi:uroporphyrin-III C-methyltransferase/precorrin-2 dehydrogenase/sirohydrochlorin ferrochelatase